MPGVRTRGDVMTMAQKYYVLKADEVGDEALEDVALAEGTYFVIRDQDVFGAASLFGYAHLIQTTLELDRARDHEVLDDVERARLSTLADDLVSLALDWQIRGGTKVPD